jgi:hypothetical protein
VIAIGGTAKNETLVLSTLWNKAARNLWRGFTAHDRVLSGGEAICECSDSSVVATGIAGSTAKLRLCSADGAALRLNRYTPKAAIKICAAMIVCERPRCNTDIANPAIMGPATAPTP